MKSIKIRCLVLLAAILTFSEANAKKINILWGDFSRPATLKLVSSELTKEIFLGKPDSAPEVAFPVNLRELPANPFAIVPSDFYIGFSRPYKPEPVGPVPTVSDLQGQWFNSIKPEDYPDAFVIAGHQVISEGWHDDEETGFMFLPTLLKTIEENQSARAFFNHIKLPILWGCNTMTNLEPHGPHGEYLTPQQIKKLYDSGPAGKLAVIGSPDKVNTLEFYRSRLAREYGPGMPHYEYTRSKKAEVCKEPPYGNCPITNVDRIMPDSYLWDGNHWYNYPYMMKRLFPNANIVMGFSSASPDEEIRVKIFQNTLEKSYAEVNAQLKLTGKKINNLLYPLVSENSPDELNRLIVQSLRKNWTLSTYAMNRSRPSGSVTPRYPDLDAHGILGSPLDKGSAQYGPYEERGNPLMAKP